MIVAAKNRTTVGVAQEPDGGCEGCAIRRTNKPGPISVHSPLIFAAPTSVGLWVLEMTSQPLLPLSWLGLVLNSESHTTASSFNRGVPYPMWRKGLL